MKKTIAEKILFYRFRCPYCDTLWALGNDSKYDEQEQEYFDDLVDYRQTEIQCTCNKKFKVKVKL